LQMDGYNPSEDDGEFPIIRLDVFDWGRLIDIYLVIDIYAHYQVLEVRWVINDVEDEAGREMDISEGLRRE
jgi:hypothetical protein